MKKKYFLVVVLALFSFLSLCACSTKKQLQSPTSIGVQLDEQNKVYLVCNDNPNASGYLFYMYDGLNYENLNLYNEISSRLNIIEITDYLENAKDYYFYCKAVGKNDFSTSGPSKVIKYENVKALSPTTIQLDNKQLKWVSVPNALNYSVYCNNARIATITQTSLNVEQYLNSETSCEFYVVCERNGNFTESAKSNVVSYTPTKQLNVPTDLVIVGNVLRWTAVENAESYTVLINGKTEIVVSNNFCDVESYIADLGVTTFKVKTNPCNAGTGSAYSNVIEKVMYQTLSAPKNLSFSKNNGFYEISWDSVENAESYTILINGTTFKPLNYSNSLIISEADLNQFGSKVELRVIANAIGYYKQSSASTSLKLK